MEALYAVPVSLPLLVEGFMKVCNYVITLILYELWQPPPLLLHLLSLLAQVLLWLGEQLPRSWETQDYSSVLHITCHSIFSQQFFSSLLWEPHAVSPLMALWGWRALTVRSSLRSDSSYFSSPSRPLCSFKPTTHGLFVNSKAWGQRLKVKGLLCLGREKKRTQSMFTCNLFATIEQLVVGRGVLSFGTQSLGFWPPWEDSAAITLSYLDDFLFPLFFHNILCL